MIQLLSLFFHLFQLIILYFLGLLVTYTLFLVQFIFIKIEQFKGKIISPRAQHIFKEVNYFYTRIMPTFFFNLKTERLLTLNGIETLYSNLPILLRLFFAIIFTLFIMYFILFVGSYLYYYIIIQ
jgi:hypothetical protein